MKDFSLSFIFRRLSTILAVATLTLTLIAASSGVLLAFYYEPSAGGAYNSLKTIDTDVSYGWLIHTMHNLSGNWVIGVALIQIVVMFLSERFRQLVNGLGERHFVYFVGDRAGLDCNAFRLGSAWLLATQN